MLNKSEKDLYYSMLRIRMVEERIAKLYSEEEMRCPVHLSIGQEAIAVGVCEHLQKNDIVMSGHRAHAHYLAKGGNLKSMMAELYGKSTGCAMGKGGSMHLIDLKSGFFGAVPIVGSTIPIAVGVAWAFKMKNSTNIATVFLGDGATEEGVFFESLDFASLHKLPILFVCENNGYAEATATEWHLNTDNLRDITKAYNMHSIHGDGMNVFDVFKKTSEAINFVKDKSEPVFLEFKSYRFSGQYEGDNQLYQSPDEIEKEKKRDPILLASNIFSKYFSEEEFLEIKEKAKKEVNEAFEYAESQDWPLPEDTLNDVYVNYPIDLIKCEN